MQRNYLLIIGNGFDLSHNIETDYKSFIRFLVDSQMQINSQYGLFSSLHKLSFEEVLADIKHNRRIVFNNDFFFELLNTFSANNWCDIEELYFNLLLKCKSLEEVKKLNQEFDIIKKHLENYLNSKMKILEKIKKIDTYCALFALLEDQNSLILNFNYTDTLKIYDISNRNSKLIHIHGKIKDLKNPIIFGFAADEKQTRELVNKGNEEWIKNIKRHCYKSTSNYDTLSDFLSKDRHGPLTVMIIGHSCGISDKLILKQIFNNNRVSKIYNFYYRSYDNYFKSQYNIDRIMNNDNGFDKLVNFHDSIEMPQWNDPIQKQNETCHNLSLIFQNNMDGIQLL